MPRSMPWGRFPGRWPGMFAVRVPVTENADKDLSNLRFDPGLLLRDVIVTVKIDPAESEAG
jgi:hypothetical protein